MSPNWLFLPGSNTAEYGWNMQVYVRNGGKRGFLDLYDSAARVYYEVKSYGSRKAWATRKQMEKYDGSRIKDNRFEGTSVFNSGIKRGNKTVRGKFAYGIYDVTYYTYSAGLIVYETNRNWKRTAAVAMATVAILLAATGNVAAAIEVGVTLPSFA